MMRLPLPAVFAALVVVAAATVLVTLSFKQSTYTINATDFAVGEGRWIYLSYIPQHITLIGFKNSTFTAEYRICIYADAVWNATGSRYGVVYTYLPVAESQCFLPVVDGDFIQITVRQMLTKYTNSTIFVQRTR